MQALQELEVNCDLLQGNSTVYLHCCTPFHSFEVKVLSLPFLSMCYCHISFIDSLAERSALPYCEAKLKKLEGLKSPCVINVLSSVVYEMVPEDVENEDTSILLIWSFNVSVLSASASAMRPFTPPKDNLQVAPLLDLSKCSCNCSSYPNIGLVLFEGLILDNDNVSGATSRKEDSDVENDDDGEECTCINSTTFASQVLLVKKPTSADDLNSELFQLKGSSHHNHFQDYLRLCKHRMLSGTTTQIRWHLEPGNKRMRMQWLSMTMNGDHWHTYRQGKCLKFTLPLPRTK